MVIKNLSLGTTPSDEVRKMAARLMQEMAQNLLSNSVVVEKDGFVGAAIRAFAAGLSLFSSGHNVLRIYRTVDDALEDACSLPQQSSQVRGRQREIATAVSAWIAR